MVQAHRHELLNQKEAQIADSERPVYHAMSRLLAAIERLELASSHKAARPPATAQPNEQLAFFENENRQLKQERAKLDGAITQLKSQYGQLHDAANTIYDKLDDSIRRMSEIIDA